jgi:hypothetical protein
MRGWWGLRKRMAAVLGVLIVLAVSVGLASTPAAASARSGWKWAKSYHVKHLTPIDAGLACPTTKLCVAVGDNRVLWSTNPTGGSKTWHSVALEPSSSPDVQGTIAFDGLSCPTAHFCAAVDDIGNVFTTTNPTGGKSAWHGTEIDDIELLAVGCSGPSLCAALDYYGNAFTSKAPSSGIWHRAALTTQSGAEFYGVSCAGSSLCVGVEAGGTIYRTNNPGAVTPKWRKTKVGRGAWDDVNCPTAHKCVAVGGYNGKGRIAVSTNPAGGVWKYVVINKASFGFNQMTCRGSGFCFALSDWWSANPVAKKSAWHSTKVPTSDSQVEIGCPTTKLCLIGDIGGDLTVGRRH